MEELAKLQDSVPSAPFDKVKPIIEKDLGPIDEKFDSIDPHSISGASLGQVYRATMSGQQVVVKVKRPGIENMVREDLKVLKKVLPLALRFVDPNLRYSAKAMLAQFIETIREEMDYTNESQNLKKIKKDMESNSSNTVVVPSVYDNLSSKNVLTMEYLPGIKITNVQALDEKGIDREQLVIDVHKVFFYHAAQAFCIPCGSSSWKHFGDRRWQADSVRLRDGRPNQRRDTVQAYPTISCTSREESPKGGKRNE